MTLDLDGRQQDASLFHLLVDSVQDYAIFALSPAGEIVSWNRGAERIKGYRADEVIGKHFGIFYTPEERAAGVPEAVLKGAAEQGRVEREGWRVRKDGRRFWASVVMTALHGPRNELVGFAKVTRDLTERRAAELALRRRERQLTDAQHLAGLGSWEWDAEGDRVLWSDALRRIHGLSAPERIEGGLAGHLERNHPDDRKAVRAAIDAAYREGSVFELEERIVRSDGSIRVLRSRGRAMEDDAGKVTGVVVASVDITDLKESEERAIALAREQEARVVAERTAGGLRFLIEASEVLSSSLDYEATLRNVAELAVPQVADWCAVDLLVAPDDLQRVAIEHADPERVELAQDYARKYPPIRDAATGVWPVIETGEPQYYPDVGDEVLASIARNEEQLSMMRRLGIRSAVVVPLSGRAGVVGALTLVQAESGRRISETDVNIALELGRHAGLAIENARLHHEMEEQNGLLAEQASELEMQTEELQAQARQMEELMERLEGANEELLQRTREAEEANRAKSDFLATMSHELRTPLNAIFGYADLLALGIHGPITPAQQEALARIKRSQTSLLSLINDVLNFAKLEAGKLEVTLTEVSVPEVISGLETMVGPQLRAKKLRYDCRDCEEERTLLGERERVEQILLNLLTNAIKFTDEGGSVSISVEAGQDVVRMHVHDTGPGVPPDRLDVIFDPFVQVGRAPTGSGERGVGLGLAISRDLAEAMGGTLTVESTLGEGSTFTLTLPRASAE